MLQSNGASTLGSTRPSSLASRSKRPWSTPPERKSVRGHAPISIRAKQTKKDAAAKLAAERAQEKATVAEEARLNRERAEVEKTLQELTGR